MVLSNFYLSLYPRNHRCMLLRVLGTPQQPEALSLLINILITRTSALTI
ncbi:hypothetical protein PROVRUST_05693 [Providencia rustigianii DSM 4541]|uniref:Uncharacterized protein n=1 Tax=Providencia rustigianii DSM 4541 TaxID=500637 RepID=D1P0M6_9GAMM|nr:hypothetical protein PROVRUST_05693 [Providencia rustigianii DSM 4541]